MEDRGSDPSHKEWKLSWDQEAAEAAIGKVILVGITYLAADGETVRQQAEYYGIVAEVNSEAGVTIKCQGEHAGRTLVLPPDMQVLSPGPPGEYRLRSTGELVVNPDFVTEWSLTEPTNH